jgi:hypothetical protein
MLRAQSTTPAPGTFGFMCMLTCLRTAIWASMAAGYGQDGENGFMVRMGEGMFGCLGV